MPVGLHYRTSSMAEGAFQVYWFEKNLQGDIIALYNNAGTKLATYSYDAWGKLLSVTDTSGYAITSSTHIANINPFRYRGYYYDTETGLYYLNSRYYDPTTGRFINADDISYLGANDEFSSYNLYAYCGNNPVMNADSNGHAWYHVLWDWVNTIAGLNNPLSRLTALGSLAVAAIQGRWSDIQSDFNNGCFNPFNQDEGIATQAKVLSFYKGSSVVKHSFSGTCSFFGTIWAQNRISQDTIKHEYGHSVQERFLGTSYYSNIAIPSVIYYHYDLTTNGTNYDYYSTPWERTADWLGGVNRSHGYKNGSLAWGIAENLLGPIVIPFYLLFGY